ncbi:hypothetical protein FB45DRAFT_314326 [Roridomyces roridus]|uniref:DUF6534 domain-containing protein n=1 Tax=Roridomyces roridus TaxID=1738132 RepID=A0AAD7FA51_9AGAR|nr:hypothetical protein FB45DRAFT_314326 [Roridomyces roridus]
MSDSLVKLTLPMFIGTLLNWALFGMLIIQTAMFFIAFPSDPKLTKLLVLAIFILEFVQTFSNGRDMMRVFGIDWGNLEVLDEVGWAWFSTPVMGSIIASVGQVFYARRLFILGQRHVWLPALVILVSAVQLGAGIWTGVNICRAGRFSLLQEDNVAATATWLATTAICDLLIVAGTVFYLIGARTPEFRQTTNKVLMRIILMTVETGLLTAVFAIVDLYLFASYKNANYHLALCIELSKIYSNSILLILNWRAQLGQRRAPSDVHTMTPQANLSHLAFRTRTAASGTFGSSLPSSASAMRVEFDTHQSQSDSWVSEADTEDLGQMRDSKNQLAVAV